MSKIPCLPYVLGALVGVGGFFLMEWLQDAAPRLANCLFIAVLALFVWIYWPWRKRA